MLDSRPGRILVADEALQVLKKEPVGCVLLDQRMPGETGVDLITKFLQVRKDLAIVMVTGEGDEGTAVAAMKNGAMDYLVKGRITTETLQGAIRNAIEKVDMRRAIEKQRQMLLVADRHRLMVGSLGSACRRIAQPMKEITTSIEIMKRQRTSPGLLQMIDKCGKSVDVVNGILDRLDGVLSSTTDPCVAVS